jgi:hypothetical protein
MELIELRKGLYCYEPYLEPVVTGLSRYREFDHRMAIRGDENLHGIHSGGTFQWFADDDGHIGFGIWYDNPRRRPGHGGYWSSRPSVLFAYTGIRVIPCLVLQDRKNTIGYSGHLNLDHPDVLAMLTAAIPDTHELVTLHHDEQAEVSFYIIRKGYKHPAYVANRVHPFSELCPECT